MDWKESLCVPWPQLCVIGISICIILLLLGYFVYCCTMFHFQKWELTDIICRFKTFLHLRKRIFWDILYIVFLFSIVKEHAWLNHIECNTKGSTRWIKPYKCSTCIVLSGSHPLGSLMFNECMLIGVELIAGDLVGLTQGLHQVEDSSTCASYIPGMV